MYVEIETHGLKDIANADRLFEQIMRDELRKSLSGKILPACETSTVENVNRSPPAHPQVQSGRLIDSVQSEVIEQGNDLNGRFGSNVEYGKHLEYGWVARSVTYLGVSAMQMVGPYPWLGPALDANEEMIQKEFEDADARAVKRAQGQ